MTDAADRALVVGSGPSGVSCAVALLDAGLSVLMIDGGSVMDAKTADLKRRLSNAGADRFEPADLAAIRRGFKADPEGVEQKLSFGSDFPYAGNGRFMPDVQKGTACAGSLAVGGFSTVWGAAVLPFRDQDLAGAWPFGVDRLSKHYEAVIRLMPIAARRDSLLEHFPLFGAGANGALRPDPQATRLLRDIETAEGRLTESGFACGQARVAVSVEAVGGQQACCYCGLCIYGCPFDSIYNSQQSLAMLQRRPKFSYRPGWIAVTVSENSSEARVACIPNAAEHSGTQTIFRGRHVFLACGPLHTTRLLLHSGQMYEETLRLLDSRYVLFPLIQKRAAPEALSGPANKLSQVFIELLRPPSSRRTVHLQIYGYNELYREALRKLLGPLAHPVSRLILSRLLLAQTFLHSDDSPAILLTLNRPRGNAPPVLSLAAGPEPKHGPAVLSGLFRSLRQQHRSLQVIPIKTLASIQPPGRGFHKGGTFPMGGSGRFSSDLLGRPSGLARTHVVDSTIFPSIPATTITLSIMANAHRIGQEVAEVW